MLDRNSRDAEALRELDRERLEEEAIFLAGATNQFTTPFDDSPMGELRLDMKPCAPQDPRPVIRDPAIAAREPSSSEQQQREFWWHK